MLATCDVVIVGAGPAGLAAADILAGRGLDIRLLDENPHVGGQLLRTPMGIRPKKNSPSLDASRRRGLRLVSRMGQGVRVETGVQVLGLFPPDRLLVQCRDDRTMELKARCTIVATGARERFIPFPGWTLPGVFSTGAAQILLKSAGVFPAAVSLVAGSGPLPLLLARQITGHGGRVAAVLDAASLWARLQMLRALPWQAAKLLQGGWLMARLAAAGVPFHANHRVVAAMGNGRLEAVSVARMDREGRLVPGSTRCMTVDGLAVGFGFVPNIELFLQAGCGSRYSQKLGGWVVSTDDGLETSVPNLFAAGEVTGVAGGAKSLIEGRLCGLSVLDRLGMTIAHQAGLRQRLLAQRVHELSFGALLNPLCQVPRTWVETLPDETIVCRCEDVCMGDVRRRLAEGFTSAGALKKASRCGMGNCQGRICGSITADILDILVENGCGAKSPPSTRLPVKGVSLGALAKMARLNGGAGDGGTHPTGR